MSFPLVKTPTLRVDGAFAFAREPNARVIAQNFVGRTKQSGDGAQPITLTLRQKSSGVRVGKRRCWWSR